VITAFALGPRQRLKLVVLPLNALMLNVSFASGDTAAAEEEGEKGFKDIL
jgi:hypothetical protein